MSEISSTSDVAVKERASELRVVILYNKPEEFMDNMRKRFPEVTFTICTRYADLPRVLSETRPQVILATKFAGRVPRSVLLESPGLEWLSLAFAGTDMLYPWDDSKIVVTNAAGVAAQEMAQYAVAALLGQFQLFPYFAAKQSQRVWAPRHIRSATGATIGIFGLGNAGKAIADSLKALGMRVVACRANPAVSYKSVDRMYGTDELHEMLGQVDATITCAALTSQTRDLFDEAAFKAMKPGSFFVSMSRGELVIEPALINALGTGHLAGAALDVVRNEPMDDPDNPLWQAPNVMITPHSCSEFDGWITRAAQMFEDNLERWLLGQDLENQAVSKRGY